MKKNRLGKARSMKQTKVEHVGWVTFGVVLALLLYVEFFGGVADSQAALFKNFMVVALCVFVIMKSAGFAITALSHYAKETGISQYIIGFLVISIGTSLPEFGTAVMSSLSGKGIITVGNVIGASIIDITVVLGLMAVIGKRIKLKGGLVRKSALPILIFLLLPLLLGLNGTLSRLDGVLLLGAYGLYIALLFKNEGGLGKIKKQVAWKDIWVDMVVFIGCILALLLAARWMVTSSIIIATELNVPFFFVGLFLISIGTTIPELVVQVKSIKSGSEGLGFGNTFGSIITNMILILGIAALINPITFNASTFIIPAMFLIMSVFIGIVFLRTEEITWQEGIGLLLIYVTFIVTQVFSM